MHATSRFLALTGLFGCASIASAGLNSWTLTGPDGGPVSSIAIHPEQSQIAITSTERGLYRTTNGGDNWTLVQDGVYPAAQRIIFDPTNLNRVFAVNGSIWRSENAGQTFGIVTAPMPYNAHQLEITPAGTMYLGSGGGGYFFKSTDHGSTWTACARPFGNNVDSPVFTADPNPHPHTEDRLYLYIRSGTVAGINGTWRSVDGCASWIPPGPGSPGNSGPPGNVTDYAVMPGNPNRVLATSNNGVAVSDDAGVTWTTTWFWNAWWVQFDPTTSGRVFAMQGISRIIVSTDNGNTWNFGGNLRVGGPFQAALDPQVPGRMFSTSHVGPLLSTDAGEQFIRRATGIRAGTVGNFSAADDGTVYTELRPGADGVFRRDPVNGAWQPVNNADLASHHVSDYGLLMGNVSVAPTDSSLLYVGIFQNRLLRSTTGGASWEPPHPTFLSAGVGVSYTVVDPNNSQVAFASSSNEGLWKTVDGGVTWNRSNNGLAAWAGPVAIARSNSNVAYAASVPTGSSVPERVYKTTNGGASWLPTGPTPPVPNTNESVHSITIDPVDENVVYAALLNQVFKTTNGGVSWAQVTAAGDQIHTTNVLVNPSHPGTLIVPSYRSGFLRTVDGGTTWVATAPPPEGIAQMGEAVISPTRPNLVIAGLWGAGVAEYEIAADLAVTVSGVASPLPAGSNATATITVRNLGIHAASPPDLAIVVPNWITPTAPAGCTIVASVVRCEVGPLQSGAERSWQLPLAVSTPGGSGLLVASIASQETELDPTNNTATLSVTGTEDADLGLTLAASPTPLDRGATTALVATLTNNGPSASTNTELALAIPVGLSVQGVSSTRGTCSLVAGGVDCVIGTMTVNETSTVTVQLGGASAGTHAVSGDVDGAGIDGDTDQHASLNIVVRPVSDIGVTIGESADPVTVGAAFSYTVAVRNLGTDAGNVHLAVPVRAATITGVTPSAGTCAIVASAVSCDVASLAGGGLMTVVIGLNAVAPDIATATATATFAGRDTDTTNDVANVGTTMRLVGDVSVDITDDTDPVTVDANYAYIVTVRNAGPNAGPVTVIVTLSSGGVNSLTATGGGICDLTITPFKCEFASLASGAAATITAATSVGIPGNAGAEAVAQFGGFDPDASNNQANTATMVRLVADASVEIAESADPVTVGAAITYTATVRNLGPSNGRMNVSVPVTGASVTSAAPSTGGTCTTTATAVDCQFNFVPNGASVTVAISVDTALPGTATATATVTFNGTDLVAGNNSASATTTIVAVPPPPGGSSSSSSSSSSSGSSSSSSSSSSGSSSSSSSSSGSGGSSSSGGGGGGGGSFDWLALLLLGVLVGGRLVPRTPSWIRLS